MVIKLPHITINNKIESNALIVPIIKNTFNIPTITAITSYWAKTNK